MEDRIPIRLDRSLLLGRQTSKWSLSDVVFHENHSISIFNFIKNLVSTTDLTLDLMIDLQVDLMLC